MTWAARSGSTHQAALEIAVDHVGPMRGRQRSRNLSGFRGSRGHSRPAITGNVINSSYYGFENPTGPYADSCNAGCNQTADLGGGIELDLGVLGAGQSASFTYLYGISQIGENVNGLIAQVDADGAYYYIATQSSENGAYPELGTNSAIIAVATPTPEPSTMVLVGLGLCAASFLRRKRARG